jgi:hypothetical protein
VGEATLDQANPGGGGGARLIVGAAFPAVDAGVAIGDAFADSGGEGSIEGSADRVVLSLGLPFSFLPPREARGELSGSHYDPVVLTFTIILDIRWTSSFGAALLIVFGTPRAHLFAQEAMIGTIETVRVCA